MHRYPSWPIHLGRLRLAWAANRATGGNAGAIDRD